MGGGLPDLLQYYMGGGRANLLQYYMGGGSSETPKLYYVIYEQPLIKEVRQKRIMFL